MRAHRGGALALPAEFHRQAQRVRRNRFSSTGYT